MRKTGQRENWRTERGEALQPRMMSVSISLQFTDSSTKNQREFTDIRNLLATTPGVFRENSRE